MFLVCGDLMHRMGVLGEINVHTGTAMEKNVRRLPTTNHMGIVRAFVHRDDDSPHVCQQGVLQLTVETLLEAEMSGHTEATWLERQSR